MKRLRIGTRMSLGFALMLVLLSAMTALAVYKANRLAEGTAYYNDNISPSLKAITAVQVSLGDMRRMASQAMLVTDKAKIDSLEQQITAAQHAGQKALDRYPSLVSDAEDGRMYKEAKQRFATAFAGWDTLRGMMRAGATDPTQREAARTLLLGESRDSYYGARTQLERWYAYNEQIGDNYAIAAKKQYEGAQTWLLGCLALALVLGAGAAYLITRSITVPLQRALEVAEAVAAGDLCSEIEVEGRDEIARLLQALKAMNAHLREIVAEVRAGSESVATGSEQIARGNADLSQRTEVQASSLQQTASSMEHIAGTVRNSAETASHVTRLATGASDAAAQGGELVGQVVATMSRISTASRKIVDIISVIDGIAFQTNILALNAAVEAARAGEQGRGFAVVASEVRNLARRSADAAKEIKGLIGASVEQVESGARLVTEAGDGMASIIVQARQVSDMIREISAAANEQLRGMGEVNSAVAQLDRATQQNAALVEQSAAASGSLQVQAQRLVAAVGRFQMASCVTT